MGRIEEAIARDVLGENSTEIGESAEPASILLQRHRLLLRALRLQLPGPASPERQSRHIGRQVGDVVLVDQVMVCVADPEGCQRTIVSYVDGSRSMHHDGLMPGMSGLLEQMGVEMQPTPCNHHGGVPITATDRV